MMLRTMLVFLFILNLAACSDQGNGDIIGTWRYKTESSKEFTFTFDANGDYVAIEDGSIDSKGTYSISGDTLQLIVESGSFAAKPGEQITFKFDIVDEVMLLKHPDDDHFTIFEKV